jgi:hypothetical protein
MGLLDMLKGKGPKGGCNYTCLEKYLKGKIKPSSDAKEVERQLKAIAAKLPKHKKSGMNAYIRGGAWKRAFLKK